MVAVQCGAQINDTHDGRRDGRYAAGDNADQRGAHEFFRCQGNYGNPTSDPADDFKASLDDIRQRRIAVIGDQESKGLRWRKESCDRFGLERSDKRWRAWVG